ncbi:MAG: hypothetical protein M0C28_24550 [Candidatus Moduliflexus flocculans]|nr:hypothetical protein [Candidatus Moduliflexus flocculans]
MGHRLADLSGTVWKHPADAYGFDYSRDAHAGRVSRMGRSPHAVGDGHRPPGVAQAHPRHVGQRRGLQPRRAAAGLGRERRPAATGRRANGRHRRDLGRSEGRQGSRDQPGVPTGGWSSVRRRGRQARSGTRRPDASSTPSPAGRARSTTAAFSPDSRWVAVGWTGGDARVVDVSTGADVVALGGHAGGVYAVAFHPSGRLLATGGGDRKIRLWELPSGKLLRVLDGHTELVYGLDFLPDGSRLASSSSPIKIAPRHPERGESVLAIPFPAQVYGVKFSPDGRTLAALPMNGTVRPHSDPGPAR